MKMVLPEPFKDFLGTERVGVHIGPKTTARDGMGLTSRANKLFPLHNYGTPWDDNKDTELNIRRDLNPAYTSHHFPLHLSQKEN